MTQFDIILVSDQEILRSGLRGIVEGNWGMKVVAEAADGRSAVDIATRMRPDLAILHTRLPELNGLEAARQIHAKSPKTRILLLGEATDRHLADQALRAGALAYLLIDSPVAELKLAIDAAMCGNIYLSSRVTGALLGDYLRGSQSSSGSALSNLTSREREVLQLVAEGRSTQEIAGRLELSARTVDAHRRHIGKKLGVCNVADLTKLAIREGLASL